MSNPNKMVGSFRKRNPKPVSSPPRNDEMHNIMEAVSRGEMSVADGAAAIQKMNERNSKNA